MTSSSRNWNVTYGNLLFFSFSINSKFRLITYKELQ